MTYIWQHSDWPHFRWNEVQVMLSLSRVHQEIGYLLALMDAAGFSVKQKSELAALTETIDTSGQIEGENLGTEAIRSSVARQLGVEIAGLTPVDRHVEGVVEMMLDATRNSSLPLTDDRLFGWQAALFPTGRSGIGKIVTVAYRSDSDGPMRVVSGSMGHEKIHFEAPPASQISREINSFLDWFNSDPLEPLLKSAIAHLWFVSIHPFDDGNGRLSRAIAEMALAKADGSPMRFYSITAEIRKERTKYYSILEETQKGNLDITDWILWYLDCLSRALQSSMESLRAVRERAAFWERANAVNLNARQRSMIASLLEGFEGKMTTSKWAALCKCSQDSAARDITALIESGLMERSAASGRSTGYTLKIG